MDFCSVINSPVPLLDHLPSRKIRSCTWKWSEPQTLTNGMWLRLAITQDLGTHRSQTEVGIGSTVTYIYHQKEELGKKERLVLQRTWKLPTNINMVRQQCKSLNHHDAPTKQLISVGGGGTGTWTDRFPAFLARTGDQPVNSSMSRCTRNTCTSPQANSHMHSLSYVLTFSQQFYPPYFIGFFHWFYICLGWMSLLIAWGWL